MKKVGSRLGTFVYPGRSYRSMRRRMVPIVALAMVLPTTIASATPGSAPKATKNRPVALRSASVPPPERIPVLPSPLVRRVLTAGGTTVRREPGVLVERVPVPVLLRERYGTRAFIYRVRVDGSFPPRALRYVVEAGGRPVGYGIPTGNELAIRTVTASKLVREAPLTVRYGSSTTSGSPAAEPTVAAGGSATSAGLGRYEVGRTEYDLGDEVYQPPGLGAKVEIVADVHFPRPLSHGPYPIVLFLHGNHSSCFKGRRAGYTWPCRPGWKPLPNFEGYDYVARILASHGFIVVSVSGNGVNVLGNMVNDTGMRQRGSLLEKHLDLWHRWSTVGGGPFGDRFVGHVDMQHIGVMGHSRGGEGAVWQVKLDRRRKHPYGIDAVLPLAPVDFDRRTVNNVALAVMLPYCDGDVSDLQGVHFFDDARYRRPGDPTPKHTVTVFGANHNFFNTVWSPGSGFPGAFDDGTRGCEDRMTGPHQRGVGAAYIVSFFRRYVGHAMSQDAVWTGVKRPPGIGAGRTLTSYLAPDLPDRRRDVARFTDLADLSSDRPGGDVAATGLSLYGWCADTYTIPCLPGPLRDIHLPGLGQGVIGWAEDAQGLVRFEIPPASSDVSGFDALQFRAALNTGYTSNGGVKFQNLVVGLVDGSGNTHRVAASTVGNEALAAPSGGRSGHFIMNQVRFPLSSFEGVDLTDVRAVELRFTRTPQGVIDFADLAFSRGAA